ncbi:hypothetical protein [Aminobacter carboxidus]|uniref:ATP-dependent DNA ligase family profile domain-containing protein n=1 Tax=Aminobacter carboxidus TaxID=376165 RepID=A0ABR9GWM6_9HYPH|nr:hypothetical protein [Aminobacter carboxidus]MBE1208087.1 hypothetical protein [Aminobacter carboxidus]
MAAGPFIPFCFPIEVDKPPEGAQWTHEIKYDGYRTQLHLGATPRAFSRNGHDWSAKYRPVLAAADSLAGGRDAVIDGEIVVLDTDGRPDFHAVAGAIRWKGTDLVFFAFDLLRLDGVDLRKVPCQERRERLFDIVGSSHHEVRFSDSFEGSGADLFAKVAEMEIEGIVSKRRASTYRAGDSTDWQKTKVYHFGEYLVVGYERSRGQAPTLLLAGADLQYVGRAVPAVGAKQREQLWEALEFLQAPKFAASIGKANKVAVAVQPILRVTAKHLPRRGKEMLRHASVTEVLTPQ